MENNTNFSTATGHQLLKSETDKRVSEESGIKIDEILEERGEEIATLANRYAQDDRRKTVRAADVRKAVRDLETEGGE
jgi:histone H3/H4